MYVRKCRFIHRSVGEPAEGSLTRIHVSTNRELVFTSPFAIWMNWLTSLRELMWIAFICNRPSWYTYEKLLKNSSSLTIVSYCLKAKFLSIFWSPSWSIKYWKRNQYKTIFTTFLLVDFLSVIVLLFAM